MCHMCQADGWATAPHLNCAYSWNGGWDEPGGVGLPDQHWLCPRSGPHGEGRGAEAADAGRGAGAGEAGRIAAGARWGWRGTWKRHRARHGLGEGCMWSGVQAEPPLGPHGLATVSSLGPEPLVVHPDAQACWALVVPQCPLVAIRHYSELVLWEQSWGPGSPQPPHPTEAAAGAGPSAWPGLSGPGVRAPGPRQPPGPLFAAAGSHRLTE